MRKQDEFNSWGEYRAYLISKRENDIPNDEASRRAEQEDDNADIKLAGIKEKISKVKEEIELVQCRIDNIEPIKLNLKSKDVDFDNARARVKARMDRELTKTSDEIIARLYWEDEAKRQAESIAKKRAEELKAREVYIESLISLGLTREQALKVEGKTGFLDKEEARLNLWKLEEIEAPLRITSVLSNGFNSRKANQILKTIATSDNSLDNKVYGNYYLRFVNESKEYVHYMSGRLTTNQSHYRLIITQ